MEELYDRELTDQEIESINENTEEFLNQLKEDTKDITNVINYPEPELTEEDGYYKNMNVTTNIDTGEKMILGEESDDDFDKSFDDMVNRINEGDDIFGSAKPLSETDVIDYLSNNDDDNLLNAMVAGTDFTQEELQSILKATNRRINKEEFNVYKELPSKVQQMIDKYISAAGLGAASGLSSAQMNGLKKSVAESIIDEFAQNIQMDRAKSDFARELEEIYTSSNKDISDASLEYIDERNKAYREYAVNIEDESKRTMMIAILDRIDSARDLDNLKEFSKKTKIKSIELEKPETKVFSHFLNKYKDSSNNIYDIKLAQRSLYRHLSDEGYTIDDVNCFLIDFCKEVSHFSVDEPLDHAYMYYVMYYCAMLDADRSEKFLNNVKEVIANAKTRNNL